MPRNPQASSLHAQAESVAYLHCHFVRLFYVLCDLMNVLICSSDIGGDDAQADSNTSPQRLNQAAGDCATGGSHSPQQSSQEPLLHHFQFGPSSANTLPLGDHEPEVSSTLPFDCADLSESSMGQNRHHGVADACGDQSNPAPAPSSINTNWIEPLDMNPTYAEGRAPSLIPTRTSYPKTLGCSELTKILSEIAWRTQTFGYQRRSRQPNSNPSLPTYWKHYHGSGLW